MSNYHEFLEHKRISVAPAGFEPAGIIDALYPFQRDIVRWACRKGKACIFADCGTGKQAEDECKQMTIFDFLQVNVGA